MTWPWVSRKRYIRELGAREAAIIYAQQNHAETKATLSKMSALARALEARLQDCTDPPIGRAELEKLNKTHSFAKRKAEALEQVNAQLEADIKQIREERDAAVQKLADLEELQSPAHPAGA